MAFVSYASETFKVLTVYEKQSLADEDAANNAGVSALQGEADDISVEANSGTWYVHDASPNVRPYERESNDLRLQRATRDAVSFIESEVDRASSFIGRVPTETVMAIEDMEFRFLQGIAAVLEGRMASNINLTFDQKLKFCEEIPSGASDITNVEQLLTALPTLISAVRSAGRAFPIEHPIVYVDPRTGLRVAAGLAVFMSGPGTGNLNLGSPADLAHLIGKDWIDKLKA